jgi:hypothetical protein
MSPEHQSLGTEQSFQVYNVGIEKCDGLHFVLVLVLLLVIDLREENGGHRPPLQVLCF